MRARETATPETAPGTPAALSPADTGWVAGWHLAAAACSEGAAHNSASPGYGAAGGEGAGCAVPGAGFHAGPSPWEATVPQPQQPPLRGAVPSPSPHPSSPCYSRPQFLKVTSNSVFNFYLSRSGFSLPNPDPLPRYSQAG